MTRAKKSRPGKKDVGRPPHMPTDAMRQTVQLHAMVGTRQEIMAEILGISVDTLQRYYRSELDTSREKANAAVGGALYKKAVSGDTASMIFWMKTRARWKESIDISNDDGSLAPRDITRAEVIGILKEIHAGKPKRT